MKLLSGILEKWLADSRAYLLVLLCVILLLPSVFTGLSTDDYFLCSVMLQRNIIPHLTSSPFDAFAFLQDTNHGLQQLIERGILPWWTHPHIRIAFWRPLSALTHWLDFTIYPNVPWLMHVHNLLWYGTLCMIVLFFYRRFFSAYWRESFPAARIIYVAGLAALMYAADDAHGMAVGWISNRNASISVIFAITALLLHDRWRQQGWVPGAFMAPFCLGMGLLGGESAVAIFGYLFAYELFISRGSLLSRFFSLIPCAAVVVIWGIVYSQLGYGASGTGLYLDPGQSPMLFFSELVQRLPVLLLGQLGMPNSALWTIVSGFWPLAIYSFALLFLAFTFWMLWPMLRRDPLSRFLALGMVLAAIPSCATYPNDRLLFFTGIGGMGLVIQYIALAQQSLRSKMSTLLGRPRAATGLLFTFWVAVHMVLGPLLLPFSAVTSYFFQRPLDWGVATLPNLETGQIIIVNLPFDMILPYIILTRASRYATAPVDLRLLSSGMTAVEIEGVDAHTVIIRPQEGLFNQPFQKVFRDESLPFSTGYSFKLNGITVQITKTTAKGHPTEIRYSFELALDNPLLRWVTWSSRGFVPFIPPTAGQRIMLKKPSLFWWL
jgi:hypothetical protein